VKGESVSEVGRPLLIARLSVIIFITSLHMGGIQVRMTDLEKKTCESDKSEAAY